MPAILPKSERIVHELAEREIPVGQTWWTWWFVLPCAAAVVLGGLSGLMAADAVRGWRFVAGLACIHLFIAMAACVAILRSRRWLTIRADGFAVRSSSGRQEYLDEQVVGLADLRRTRFASGQPMGDVRRTTLWLWGPPGQEFTIPLLRHLGVDEPDVMDVLIERLKCRIYAGTVREMDRQFPAAALGWELHNGHLILTGKSSARTIDLSKLRAIDRHEGKLRLWLSNEKRPCFEHPLAVRNAWLLEELLQERLSTRANPAAENGEQRDGGPLGRILAERRPSRWTAGAIYALGFFAAMVSIVCCTVAFVAHLIFPALIGAAIGFPAAMIIALARRLSRSRFRICERGLEKTGVAGHQVLRYRDMDVFVFDARRQHSYGRYVGTLYTLTFASRQHPQQGIFHSESARHEVGALEALRERVSEQIAHRMARRYAATGSVSWTPELTLAGGSIRYRPQRRRFSPWGRRQSLRIPFDEVLDYEIQADWFHLWTIGEERAVIKVATSSPNFYPGLILLEKLCPLRDDGTGVMHPSDSA